MSNKTRELQLAPEEVGVVPSTKSVSSIKSLRLSQDYEALTDVKQVVTEIAIGRPNRQTFFRVHPDWKGVYPILEVKAEMRSDFYVVGPNAAKEIEDEVHPRLLVPLITRDGRLFLWPLRLSNGERLDNAASSSLAAMQIAKKQWIKLVWKGGSFAAFTAKRDLPDPEWPEITFDEMVELAFNERVIDSPEHRVIKSLLGDE